MRTIAVAALLAAALALGACGSGSRPSPTTPPGNPTGVEMTPIGAANQARDVAGLVNDRTEMLEAGP